MCRHVAGNPPHEECPFTFVQYHELQFMGRSIRLIALAQIFRADEQANDRRRGYGGHLLAEVFPCPQLADREQEGTTRDDLQKLRLDRRNL
jgi:hypothetical protein